MGPRDSNVESYGRTSARLRDFGEAGGRTATILYWLGGT
jgi:hypothetical protein